jgi:hypothetical protein
MAGYIGTTPVPQATQHRESFTATGGQTSFATVGYTPQFIDVYLNGVKLAPADFTATNGSDVVLASGATASDILEIVAYTPFEIASQTFTGDTTANNFAVTGTFTSRGIDDNADAVAITIDSSENVGIGSISPTSLGTGITTLELKGNSASQTDRAGGIRFERYDGTYAGAIYNADGAFKHDSGAYPMLFVTNSSEAMRIDSSGNLLVGKTSADNGATVGVELRGDISKLYVTDSASSPLIANRLTSDGNIAVFQKDGSTVGSIGAHTGDIYIASATDALKIDDNARPASTTGGTNDAAMDLGTSGSRWKDLYLSGGVYLGGTGSANYLDDYEYGTWTPSMNSYSGSVTSHGEYFKVGDMVTASFSITLDGTTDASAWRIANLPFNWDNTVGGSWGGCITKQDAGLDGHSFQVVTTNDVLIYNSSGGTRSYTNVGVNSNIRGVVTYKAT